MYIRDLSKPILNPTLATRMLIKNPAIKFNFLPPLLSPLALPFSQDWSYHLGL